MKLSTSLLILLGIALSVTNIAWSAEQTATEATASKPNSEPPADPWLADVQAQRQAWQAHREARIEAMEQQSDELREAAKQRSEKYWESRVTHGYPVDPEFERRNKLYKERMQAREAQLQTRREAREKFRKEQEQAMFQTPPGWNNPWYYRGF